MGGAGRYGRELRLSSLRSRTCTAQALDYAVRSARLALSAEDRQALLESYRRLPPFPDVAERSDTQGSTPGHQEDVRRAWGAASS